MLFGQLGMLFEFIFFFFFEMQKNLFQIQSVNLIAAN